MTDAPKRTPLYDLHVELGGKMVDFAGWEMPVQYPMVVCYCAAPARCRPPGRRSGAGVIARPGVRRS